MQPNYGNIYQNARRTAGLTQERWAELLGVSVESVRLYENDTYMPNDEIALRMAEAAGQQIICYWHLLKKSAMANRLLPKIDKKTLPEAVLNLIVNLQSFAEVGMHDLTRIAADGRVDAQEKEAYDRAMNQLGALLRAGLGVEYADKEVTS